MEPKATPPPRDRFTSQVAARAREHWEARGGGGDSNDDWFQAEAELQNEAGGQSPVRYRVIKTPKATVRQATTSSVKSPRKLRDLDERDPSNVKGGITATSSTITTSGGSFGALSIGSTKLIVPCV